MAINTKKYKATLEEVKIIENQIIERAKSNKSIEDIICPRCGGEIIFTEINNSYTVKCETPNCITYGVRGI